MGYTPVNAIDKTNLILDVLAKKQQVIGANLANIDTPGYQRQDISFEQYIGSLNSPLETNLSKKMGPSAIMTNQGVKSIRLRKSWICSRFHSITEWL